MIDCMKNIPNLNSIRVVKVKPKKIPVECPVCHNFGTLGYARKVCHGCEGKGWILVEAEEIK